ncbi:hypothetical protein KDA23_07775, partial [Candidatus Saccharibacteria bacterium]|nr:hypothetical protein [Candidatus Saccharibacteria bacterium]
MKTLSLKERHARDSKIRVEQKVNAIKEKYQNAGTLVPVKEELESLEDQITRVTFEPSVASKAIPFVAAPEWAEGVRFITAERSGRAKTMARDADDWNKLKTNRSSTLAQVEQGGIFYDYSVDTQRYASILNFDESAESAVGSAEAIKYW